MVAETDVRAERLVLPCDRHQPAKVLVLALGRRQVQRTRDADGMRNRLVHERLERRGSDRLEHPVAFTWRRAYVPAGKPVAGVESVHPRWD